MRKLLLLQACLTSLLLLLSPKLFSQASTPNSMWLPNKDTIRVLLVYAERTNDPNYGSDNPTWEAGKMPAIPDYYFDHEVSAPVNLNGKMTDFYHQASFGDYVVLGDYVDTLVQVSFSTGLGVPQVIQALDNLPGSDIITANGYSFNSNAFDQWEHPDFYGEGQKKQADDWIDVLVIMWRVNANITTGCSSGNAGTNGSFGIIKNKDGITTIPNFVNCDGQQFRIIKHEYAHNLYGGNEFHTVGAPGVNRTFISPLGGWSNLSSDGGMESSLNAWDRRRMGWKHASSTYDISARAANGSTEVNGDLETANDLPQSPYGEFVLRDFISYGDAVRIKLPYLQTEAEDSLVKDQWLWLENHQLVSDFDHPHDITKGIYAYIQVGKEDTGSYFGDAAGPSNYLWPLHALGNYDFSFSPTDTLRDTILVDSNYRNPFTGYNIFIHPKANRNHDNNLQSSEGSWPARATINGVPLADSMYTASLYKLTSGTRLDAFTTETGRNKIGIGYNPAVTPLLTYLTPVGGPNGSPQIFDNRTIHLNGISVEVLEQYTNGNVRIKVRFDDYKIEERTRWCGNILLRDKVELQPYSSVTIDQGYTPQKPVDPQTINGEKVFADSTVFTMKPLSVFRLEANSTLTIKGNSTFVMEGGILDIKDSAKVIVEDGARLILEDSAEIQVKPGGRLEIAPEGELVIRSGPTSVRSMSVGEYRPEASPPSSDLPARVDVYGQLTFDDVNWIQTAQDGRFRFFAGHSINLGPGHEISLQGIGDSTTILELFTPLHIEERNLTIEDAAIEMNGYSNYLRFKGAAINLTDVTVDGGAVKVDSVTEFDAMRVKVINADTGFVLRHVPPTVTPNYVRYCDISSSIVGVAADDVDHLIIDDSEIITTGVGVYGKNSRNIVFKGDVTSATGIRLDEVQGFYALANGTSISGNTGMEVNHSLAFLRNGAVVENCNVGVEINGIYDETDEAYTAMLTVGDVGCGSIVHNDVVGTDGPFAVFSDNAILNLDATLHAVVGGNNEYINPNNFYDNGHFDACYDDTLTAPDTVFARGNFWDPANYSLYELLKSRSDCRGGGAGGFFDIIMDTSSQSSCDPDGYVCSTCGTRDFSGLTINDGFVFNSFVTAYDEFVDMDDYDSRSGFASLAAIELSKDMSEHIWYANSIEEQVVPISHESAHLIQVAKAIYRARPAPPDAKMKPSGPVNIFAGLFTDQPLSVSLIPNPARQQLMVKLNKKDRLCKVTVYNNMGAIVLEQEMHEDQLLLNVKDIGKTGLYFVEVSSMDGTSRIVEKLLIAQ